MDTNIEIESGMSQGSSIAKTKQSNPMTANVNTPDESVSEINTDDNDDETSLTNDSPIESNVSDLATLVESNELQSNLELPPPPQHTRRRFGARNTHKAKYIVKWIVHQFAHILVPTATPETTLLKIDTSALKCDAPSPPSDQDTTGEHASIPPPASPTTITDPSSTLPLIVDVAGGKGEVAARLSLCHACRVVLVEPRPADLVHCYLHWIMPKLPNKWIARIQQRLQENPACINELVARRTQQLCMYFTETSWQHDTQLQHALEETSLVLGIHADSATEAIVQAALHYRKPFCVVPCCVFPNLFHQRVYRQQPVRTYEQFCDYLQSLHPRFERAVLPFEGRNIAIYWDGKD
jgi:hypothetical protein